MKERIDPPQRKGATVPGRRKTISRLSTLLASLTIVLALAACGSNTANNRAAATATAPAAASAAALRATAATSTPAPTPGAAGAASVQVRTGTAGSFLASPSGKTAYVFDRDTPGASNCTGACTSTWPPLAPTGGEAVAPLGLPGKLGVMARSDGAQQLTYNGRPLYTYSGDAQPGDTKGDGVGGVWHVANTVASTPTPTPARRAPSNPGY